MPCNSIEDDIFDGTDILAIDDVSRLVFDPRSDEKIIMAL